MAVDVGFFVDCAVSRFEKWCEEQEGPVIDTSNGPAVLSVSDRARFLFDGFAGAMIKPCVAICHEVTLKPVRNTFRHQVAILKGNRIILV